MLYLRGLQVKGGKVSMFFDEVDRYFERRKKGAMCSGVSKKSAEFVAIPITKFLGTVGIAKTKRCWQKGKSRMCSRHLHGALSDEGKQNNCGICRMLPAH